VADSRRLDVPRGAARGLGSYLRLDPDAVGRFAEAIARFLGTGRFLAVQTVIVIVWIALNVFAVRLQWDPYPFILLNLAFSTQAAYAAPLILLAQNRQDDRDRVSLEEDRTRAARVSAETEYLARELASMRLTLGEVVTRDFLRSELEGTRGGRSDRASDKALDKTVGKAVDRAVARAMDRAVDHALERGIERGVSRAVEAALARVGDGPLTGDASHIDRL
jgi:uncharacterized membrane protein